MVKLYSFTLSCCFRFTVVLLLITTLCTDACLQNTFVSPFSLTINFDQWPEESSWDIKLGDTTVFYSADYQHFTDDHDNTTLVIDSLHLLPSHGYYFNFYDAFIDGICCIQGDGSFALSDANGELVISGGEFEVKESIVFSVGGDLCENGIQDNGEEGVDCGGECTSCIEGCMDQLAHNYEINGQIDDGSCMTCDDGILNGDETGIDCGGALCEPCASNCPEDHYTTTEAVTSDMSISVNESIQSSHRVHSNLTIEFTAGQEILLGAGFEIDTSTVFSAEIGGCRE